MGERGWGKRIRGLHGHEQFAVEVLSFQPLGYERRQYVLFDVLLARLYLSKADLGLLLRNTLQAAEPELIFWGGC